MCLLTNASVTEWESAMRCNRPNAKHGVPQGGLNPRGQLWHRSTETHVLLIRRGALSEEGFIQFFLKVDIIEKQSEWAAAFRFQG